MFVNDIPFVVGVSRGEIFTVVEYVSQSLKAVIDIYKGKIFQFYKITDIL